MTRRSISLLGLLALLAPAGAFAQTRSQTESLAREAEADLTGGILPFWLEHVPDPAGGFYGTVMNDGSAVPDADKGAILNARILWTFSRAYRTYGLESYKETADRAAEYFRAHFIDPKYGGVFWTVDSDGAPKDVTKQIYAQAFGIYGLAEHFRATGDLSSLEAAQDLFRFIQTRAHDRARGGYLEVLTREGARSDVKGVDGRAGATKTMNTHIHLLEGFTNLYLAWQDPEVKQALTELLDILRTRLYNPETHHLILYCDDNWTPMDPSDSFGHDIETSWLM